MQEIIYGIIGLGLALYILAVGVIVSARRKS